MDSSASVEVIKSSLIERESNFVIFPRYDPFKTGSYILGKLRGISYFQNRQLFGLKFGENEEH